MSNFESYLDPAYVYNFTQGPNVVRSHEDAKQYGLNCVALAHLVLEDVYGTQLPANMRCYEMFTDDEHFDTVPDVAAVQAGDLVWFGVANPKLDVTDFVPIYQNDELVNWPDFPVKHVGIAIGKEEQQDPSILHATWFAGTNVIWPLSKFARYQKYAKIYGIQRYKQSNIHLVQASA